MPKLNFSQIDAKECDVISVDDHYISYLNKTNYEVLLNAQKEYLDKLDALQKEIAQKYEPLLIEQEETNKKMSYEDEKEISDKIIDNSQEYWEKHRHLYYT